MSGYGPRVGLSFHEAMSGALAFGAATADEGAERAAGAAKNFAFSLFVDISSLRDFLAAPAHVAAVTAGKVWLEGVCPEDTPILSGGTIQMYRDVTPDGRVKDFIFLFSFRGEDGRVYTFSGEKRLRDDSGFDTLADLSQVFGVVQADGRPIAAGLVKVHPDELWEQVVTLRVRNTTGPGESAAARAGFFSFMNEQLAQVYPGTPRLFHDDDQRFLRGTEWRAISLLVQATLPDPLPPDGPTVDETIAYVQEFVRAAPPGALDEVRSLLRLVGIPAGLIPVSLVRAWLASEVQAATPAKLNTLDRLKALVTVPYYAHPRSDRRLGYERPTFRPSLGTRLPVTPDPPGAAHDVVIVGAGVAGALLAARLTARGKSVLLLEAGAYTAEHELSTDELRMTARLYKAAGLQTTRDEVTILQARCVGGGGVVNNAICFQLPSRAVARWRDTGFPIDEPTLREAYARVAAELSIQPISAAMKAGAPVNPASRFLGALGAVQTPSVAGPPPEGLSECLVNLEQCEGAGLCNSGCGNERKKNSFQVYLRAALATGRCTLVPEARVVDLRLDGRRVSGVRVEVRGRMFDVAAGEVIVAAGAIASSSLLLRSQVAARHPALPIGQRFTANIGCPTFVFTRTPLHPTTSLQISHAYLPPGGEHFVVESWYGPPGTIALAMPGYLGVHAARMRRYASATVLAPLVGVRPVGSIRLEGGRERIDLPVGNPEVARLRFGLATIAEAVLGSGDADVESLLLGTRTGFEVRTRGDLEAFLATPTPAFQLRLGSGHPQGGNAMSEDPAISVVDGAFRVRGVDNLRVCDASVFPDVAGVNPQWTVMALADLCARTFS